MRFCSMNTRFSRIERTYAVNFGSVCGSPDRACAVRSGGRLCAYDGLCLPFCLLSGLCLQFCMFLAFGYSICPRALWGEWVGWFGELGIALCFRHVYELP